MLSFTTTQAGFFKKMRCGIWSLMECLLRKVLWGSTVNDVAQFQHPWQFVRLVCINFFLHLCSHLRAAAGAESHTPTLAVFENRIRSRSYPPTSCHVRRPGQPASVVLAQLFCLQNIFFANLTSEAIVCGAIWRVFWHGWNCKQIHWCIDLWNWSRDMWNCFYEPVSQSDPHTFSKIRSDAPEIKKPHIG